MDVSSSPSISAIHRVSQEGFRSHVPQRDVQADKVSYAGEEHEPKVVIDAHMQTTSIPVEERLQMVMDIGEIRRLLYLAGSYEPLAEDRGVGKKADVYS